MSLLVQAQQAVESNQLDDFTDIKKGGNFERRLLPTGTALVRFSTYVEMGVHPQRAYKGKAKPPAPEMKLGFHVVGGMGKDLEGKTVPFRTPEDVENGYFPPIRNSYGIVMGRSEASKSVQIFNAMNYAKDATHFVEKLGQLYLLKSSVSEDGKYNNFDLTTLAEPVDPMTATVYTAPELPEDKYQLLLWNAPTKEQWDSIFIEGTTKGDDGVEKSKNYIQEKIKKAMNFVGSAIEQLVLGGDALPTLEVEGVPAVPTLDDD